MNNELKNIIQEQFKLLPKIIQDTILNSNWEEKIRRVVKNNNLHVDQGAAIENLVLITMLGIETPETFVQNAKEYAEVSEEQAYTISSEVEREIFGDIRRKLIELTDTTDTVEEIDHTANELDRVASAIEKESQKTPLKEKIPVNSFAPNSAPTTPSVPNVPKLTKLPPVPPTPITTNAVIAPVITEKPVVAHSTPAVIEKAVEAPKIPKPIFTPMPKTIPTQTPVANTSTPNVKLDPYREPVE